MKNRDRCQIPDVEAEQPSDAVRNLEEFTRRILSIPKKEIDKSMAKEKARKDKKRH